VRGKDPLMNGESVMGINKGGVEAVRRGGRQRRSVGDDVYYGQTQYPTQPLCFFASPPLGDFLDLEHSIVYNDTVQWNALVGTRRGGGRFKYIFNAYAGSEQLFNLPTDQNEGVDLALWGGEDVKEGVLKRFREVMVKQLEEEGRRDNWVKDGKLMVRKSGTVHGDNYPCL